jgi:TRAP-type C4-dicarboxylate transport system permease small subunit
MVAATQNETMRQLTTVTLIFLPLTFLAGYFGMNFSINNWHVLTNNGPMYFWVIAIPTTIAITTLVGFSYLHHLWKILRRQIERKGIKVKLRKNREMRRHRSSIAISRSESMELPTESEQGQLE